MRPGETTAMTPTPAAPSGDRRRRVSGINPFKALPYNLYTYATRNDDPEGFASLWCSTQLGRSAHMFKSHERTLDARTHAFIYKTLYIKPETTNVGPPLRAPRPKTNNHSAAPLKTAPPLSAFWSVILHLHHTKYACILCPLGRSALTHNS